MSTLQELEQRIQALEQNPQADQLTPGVFSLSAAGGLEEKLSGKLEAQGITFNLSSEEKFRMIEWADGQQRARIVGGTGPGPGSNNVLLLETLNEAGVFGAQLELAGERAGGLAQVAARANEGHGVIIVNQNQQSSFLQLATLANVAISFGSTVLNFVASVEATVEKIPAGLPAERAPKIIIPVPSTPGFNLFCQIGNTLDGKFNLKGTSTTGAETLQVTVPWIAIG
jgi:hypothetical protein